MDLEQINITGINIYQSGGGDKHKFLLTPYLPKSTEHMFFIFKITNMQYEGTLFTLFSLNFVSTKFHEIIREI